MTRLRHASPRRPPQCSCGRAPAIDDTRLCAYCTMRRSGFKPPIGPGRCRDCGFHMLTQHHRAGCPRTAKAVNR